MISKLCIFLVCLCLFIPRVLVAQTQTIDSLYRVVESAPDDTVKVNTIIDLCVLVISNKPDEAVLLATQAKELSEQLDYLVDA